MNELSNQSIAQVLGSNFDREKKWKRQTLENVDIWKYEDDWVESFFAVENKRKENLNDLGGNSAYVDKGIQSFEESGKFEKINKGKNLKCDLCEATFRDSSRLKSHKKIKHEGFRLKCNQCEATFTQPHNLKKHESKHVSGGRLVEKKCDQCDAVFSCFAGLYSHKKSKHEGLRFKCNDCDATFTQKHNLDAHKKSKHEGFRLKCNECDATFTLSQSLKSHVKKKHGKTDCDKKEDEDSEAK